MGRFAWGTGNRCLPGQWRTLVSSPTRPFLTSEPHCPETDPFLAPPGVSLQHRGCPGSKVFVFLWGKGPCPPTWHPPPPPAPLRAPPRPLLRGVGRQQAVLASPAGSAESPLRPCQGGAGIPLLGKRVLPRALCELSSSGKGAGSGLRAGLAGTDGVLPASLGRQPQPLWEGSSPRGRRALTWPPSC